MNPNVSVIILAAGSSKRLGRPKQLVQYKDSTLLGYSTDAALTADLGETIVVFGERDYLDYKSDKRLKKIHNPDWKMGMGHSLAIGIAEVNENASGAIIMLCDQPFVSAELLQQIAKAGLSEGGIVVSDYGTASGPPSYFDKKYFAELSQLEGDDGAKHIVGKNKNDVSKIIFSEGIIDIDTEEDLQNLNSREQK